MTKFHFLSELTKARHIYTGPGELTTLEALRMAQERDVRIRKTTIFQVGFDETVINEIKFSETMLYCFQVRFHETVLNEIKF